MVKKNFIQILTSCFWENLLLKKILEKKFAKGCVIIVFLYICGLFQVGKVDFANRCNLFCVKKITIREVCYTCVKSKRFITKTI